MKKPAQSVTTVVWFRQDLRVVDNPALVQGVEQGAIIPVYILDEVNAGKWSMGGASRWWLHHSLQALDQALSGQLQIFSGDPLVLLPELLAKWQANAITWNRCYEPWRIKRDGALKQLLTAQGYQVNSHNGSLLWEPWQVLKGDSTPYRVFTPYYRNGCLQATDPRFPIPKPEKIPCAAVTKEGASIDALDLLPSIPWDQDFYNSWQPGETGAMDRLQQFLTECLPDYKEGRDVPSLQTTSRLSPHLHFGELSPNQVWYAALNRQSSACAEALECFLRELGWREFSYYLLYHFPALPEKNFQPKFDAFPWSKSKKLLLAWQQGRTGIPIVDAGMRELWQTGYMHNRVRMIVASFLVKNLRQHWHHGEQWFWDCLLDADLASNAASWQWVAGSGADAAPYFRIFNPVTQGEKFDKQGLYVRHFCPELEALPDKYLHKPWEAPETVLTQAGIKLGKQYPKPLVDLKVSRQQALDCFSTLSAN